MRTLLGRLRRRFAPPPAARAAAPDRVQTAIAARLDAVNDFFGGWEEQDVILLERYRVTPLPVPAEGEIVDWLGIRTAAERHAWLSLPADRRLTIAALPVPDDQVHAETIEYVALLVALERAKAAGRSDFAAIELGASYAPWAVAAGVMAQRLGFARTRLMAVEANGAVIPRIHDHARRNGLLDQPQIRFDAIHGAIHTEDREMYFPKVDVAHDNGGQVSDQKAGSDYRGLALDYETVQASSFASLSRDLERIDFLHMDVQGAEAALLENADFVTGLSGKVASFFLATQSRLIEGLALKALSGQGWQLLRERPTSYKPNARTRDINGWTLRDGGQIWLNPRFGSLHLPG